MGSRLKYVLVFGDFEGYFGVNSKVKMIATVCFNPGYKTYIHISKSCPRLLANRGAYEDSLSAQTGLTAVHYRHAATFLKSLVRARVFGVQIRQVSDLTNAIITEKIEEIASKSRTVSVEAALPDVKRNVGQNVNQPNARIRIIILSASYLELCEKRGWNFAENS